MSSRRLVAPALLVNLALAAWVGYLLTTRPGPRAALPATAPPSRAEAPAVAPAVPGTDQVVTNTVREPFTWAKVESRDYPQYIANLRAIDCPEAIIQDIIITDVAKHYARKKAARMEARTREFWKTASPQPGGPSSGLGQAPPLEKERRALLVELLGPDAERERKLISGVPDWRGRSLAYLPEPKRDQVIELQDKFEELERAVSRQNREAPVNAAWASGLRDLRVQQRAELASLLSPQELEEYDLRHSEVSQRLRADLTGFSPTEQEFRGMFRLQMPMENRLDSSQTAPDDPLAQQRLVAAQRELEQGLRSFLGEPRYAEYKRAKDWEYKALLQVAREHQLPPAAAGQVYDLRKMVEEQKRQLTKDPSLTPEARQAALRALQSDTERALAQTMGDQAYQAYKRRHSWWIRSLAP